MAFKDIDMSEFLDSVKDTVSEELKDTLAELDEKHRKLFEKIVKKISEECLLIALSPEAEKPKHRRRLKHYKAALTHMRGIGLLNSYSLIVNITGKILAATIKSLLLAV